MKSRETEENEEWEEEEDEKPKKRWVKPVIILSVILLLSFGMYQIYSYVSGMFAPQEMILEDVTNLPLEEAIEKLQAQGLRVDASRRVFHEEIEEDHVISQDPAAGERVREGNFIRLTVSKGMEQQSMPNVTYLKREAAISQLVRNGFIRENIETVDEFGEESADTVMRQEPVANEEVNPATTKVILVISKGKETYEMPNLIGLTEAQAEAELERRNLPLEKVERALSDQPKGIVYMQHPVDPGQQVEAGTPIRIWVSEGYAETSRTKTEEFIVFVRPDEEPPVISIFVTDQNGSNRKVVDEKIYETKGYQVTVTVTRERSGVITVFKNGEEFDNRTVTFE